MSIKRAVKQFGAALTAAVAMIFVTTSAHAFTSVQVNQATATVTVGGGSVAMSITIRDVGTQALNTQIGWTASAGQSWKTANQFIRIASTLTVAGSGIQTYTDNKGAGASPLYTGSTTTAAGLVNTSNPSQTLPTGWEIVAQGNAPQPAGDPNTNPVWFYHKDKSHQDFVNAMSYIELETSGNPPNIQFAQTSFGAGAANGVNDVYLESNFQSALGGTTYKTSTLTVELFNP